MGRTASFVGLFLLAISHTAMSVTIEDFFSDKDIKGNLTKVTWSHAVNTKAELDRVLSSNQTMMIEADVIMKKLSNDPQNVTYPVMGHPPMTENIDLKLEDFIKKVLESKKMGMKLDFKSIDALESGVTIISKEKNISVPLWINADILRGPNATDDTKAVDAKRFFAAVEKLSGDVLLSIGWTTNVTSQEGQNVTFGQYTKAQTDEMVKELKDSKTNKTVTYPVRAIYVANDDKDIDVLGKLLEENKDNKPTLTIWSSKTDVVNATKLSEVIKRIGLDKIYLDVPMELRQKLDLNGAFSLRSSASVLFSSVLVAIAAFKLL